MEETRRARPATFGNARDVRRLLEAAEGLKGARWAEGGASMSFVKASLSGLGWFGVAGVMRRARRFSVSGVRRRCRRGAWRTGR
ncbi:hypothetical protein ACWEJQ_09440 [Streptomyces albidoflavus]